MKAQIIVLLAIFVSLNAHAEKTLQECIDTINPQERLNCYDAIFNSSKSGNEPVRVTNSDSTFGQEQVRKKDDQKTDKTLKTSIVGSFKYLSKGDKINLSNGQQWIVVEDRKLHVAAENPEVILSEGFFGSYFLEFPGKNRRIKVRRLK